MDKQQFRPIRRLSRSWKSATTT